MEEYSSKNTYQEQFSAPPKKTRGAKVYGVPFSKELGSYIDQASPRSKHQLFLNMFFAGKVTAEDFFTEEIEEDEF